MELCPDATSTVLNPIAGLLCELKLPNHLQSELYFSRGYCQLIDRARSSDGSACTIKECTVVYWRQKGSVIEHVKELCPNLDIEVFGDRFDIVVLENREIEVKKAWPDHAISSHVAQ